MQLKGPATGAIVAAQVRPEFEDGRPQVRDLALAEWLGYERPAKIRELIRRNRLEIEALGIIPTVGKIREGAGRPADAATWPASLPWCASRWPVAATCSQRSPT
jgi:hypothetical protein